MIFEIVEKQKKYFNSSKTLDINFRLDMLNKLKKIIIENNDLIENALYEDLHKSKTESYMTEIGMALSEINDAIKHLKKWSKVKKVKTLLANFPAKSYIIKEPYGNVLIISPWNYPFLLSINPLISAIAAGNTAIIKPSEYSVNTSNVLFKIINENFDEEYLKVILGGIEETTELLKQKFDLIFFTGSPRVGKIVMSAASNNLTKVILELGGKSPVIVDDTTNLKIAAKRIAFGKFLNAGQTCVAPDFLIVKKNAKKELIDYLLEEIEEISKTSEYCHIISKNAVDCLNSLIDDNKVIYRGKISGKRMEPVILDNVTFADKVMQEEIFGPILPIMEYSDEEDLVEVLKDYQNQTSYPLAFYIFSTNKKFIKELMKLRFGGGCINDTINHLASHELPFGGIGNSGMGNYHGEHGFLTFSHEKSILKKSLLIDVNLRYYPYTSKKNKTIRKFLK